MIEALPAIKGSNLVYNDSLARAAAEVDPCPCWDRKSKAFGSLKISLAGLKMSIKQLLSSKDF
jgi:hypothetical protein